VHIAAFAATIGTVLTVEMLTLGLQKAIPLRELGRLGVKIALAALAAIGAEFAVATIPAARTVTQPKQTHSHSDLTARPAQT
jgi:2-methylisocitrate lyase-like PEP mutase family enzyme